MVLSDQDISKALKQGLLLVRPEPAPEQYEPSSLALRVGEQFVRWRPADVAAKANLALDLDRLEWMNLLHYLEPIQPNEQGVVILPPGQMVLAQTLETIELPPGGKISARIEGLSIQSRLGLLVNVASPLIQPGFGGRITLELFNFGPFSLAVHPNQTRTCRLVLEEVTSEPTLMSRTTTSSRPVASG
jgi:dCTP deaminase